MILVAVFACGCATLTPEGARVKVYRAQLDAQPEQRSMPAGCQIVATKPPLTMPEIDLDGQKDPFRTERNEAGAAGANALLVLWQRVVGRRNAECVNSSPITDCPGSFGA